MSSDTNAGRARRSSERLLLGFAVAVTGLTGLGTLVASHLGGTTAAAVWLCVAVIGAVLTQRVVWERIARPVQLALDLIERIATGESVQVEPQQLGAMAHLAPTLLALSSHQRTLSERVDSVRGDLQEIPERMAEAVQEIDSGRAETEEAVEETASLLANINTSIRSINGELDNLSRSTEEASSSILEMQSSVDEVARSTGSLNESVDASTSSIHQISASIRQVAESADSVQSMAEESAAAMVQMDRAIQEVGEQSRAGDALLSNAESALELCRQVHRSTEEQRESGRFITASISAVTEMIRSIQRNTEGHRAASEAVSDAVSRILDVARKSGERTPELIQSLDALRAQASALGAIADEAPAQSASTGLEPRIAIETATA